MDGFLLVIHWLQQSGRNRDQSRAFVLFDTYFRRLVGGCFLAGCGSELYKICAVGGAAYDFTEIDIFVMNMILGVGIRIAFFNGEVPLIMCVLNRTCNH